MIRRTSIAIGALFFLSTGASAQLYNCSNVHNPACSKSPFAPTGYAPGWGGPGWGPGPRWGWAGRPWGGPRWRWAGRPWGWGGPYGGWGGPRWAWAGPRWGWGGPAYWRSGPRWRRGEPPNR